MGFAVAYYLAGGKGGVKLNLPIFLICAVYFITFSTLTLSTVESVEVDSVATHGT